MPKILTQELPKPNRRLLVNRGSAGLLTKVQKSEKAEEQKKKFDGPKDRIVCKGEIVDINSIKLDPNNCRLHPERNLDIVRESLSLYGQRSCIIVRQENMTVAKGNGTLESARSLEWTKIAVDIQSMTDAEFAGYAIVDNRSSEFGRWDFEVLAAQEKLVAEAGQKIIGWSEDEIESLRAGDFEPPPQDFPTVDENLETQHVCPRCNYKFSGGEVVQASMNGDGN